MLGSIELIFSKVRVRINGQVGPAALRVVLEA